MRPNRNGNRADAGRERTFPAVFSSRSRVSGNATNATTANIATMLSTKCVWMIVYGALRFRLSYGAADAHLFARHAQEREREEASAQLR